MMAGGANVVGAFAHGECGFGGNQDWLRGRRWPCPGFLRRRLGVDVGGVKEIDSGVEANIDEAGGLLYVGIAPGLEEFAASAESASAKAENRNF